MKNVSFKILAHPAVEVVSGRCWFLIGQDDEVSVVAVRVVQRRAAKRPYVRQSAAHRKLCVRNQKSGDLPAKHVTAGNFRDASYFVIEFFSPDSPPPCICFWLQVMVSFCIL